MRWRVLLPAGRWRRRLDDRILATARAAPSRSPPESSASRGPSSRTCNRLRLLGRPTVLVHLDASPLRWRSRPRSTNAKRINAPGGPVPEICVRGDQTRSKQGHDRLFPTPERPRRRARTSCASSPRSCCRDRITLPGRWMRILYGRSDSGLFALYALVEAPTLPGGDRLEPSLDRCPEFVGERFTRLFRERPDLGTTLFLIYGSNELRVSSGSRVRRADPRVVAAGFTLGVSSVPNGGHVPRNSLEEASGSWLPERHPLSREAEDEHPLRHGKRRGRCPALLRLLVVLERGEAVEEELVAGRDDETRRAREDAVAASGAGAVDRLSCHGTSVSMSGASQVGTTRSGRSSSSLSTLTKLISAALRGRSASRPWRRWSPR